MKQKRKKQKEKTFNSLENRQRREEYKVTISTLFKSNADY